MIDLFLLIQVESQNNPMNRRTFKLFTHQQLGLRFAKLILTKGHRQSVCLSDNFLVDRLFDMFRNKENGEENQITRYIGIEQ